MSININPSQQKYMQIHHFFPPVLFYINTCGQSGTRNYLNCFVSTGFINLPCVIGRLFCVQIYIYELCKRHKVDSGKIAIIHASCHCKQSISPSFSSQCTITFSNLDTTSRNKMQNQKQIYQLGLI